MKYDKYVIRKKRLQKVVDIHMDLEAKQSEYPNRDEMPINRWEEWYTGNFNSFSKPSIISKKRVLYKDKKGRFTTSPLTDFFREKDRLANLTQGLSIDLINHGKEHGKMLVIKRHRESIRNYIKAKELQVSKEFRRKSYSLKRRGR